MKNKSSNAALLKRAVISALGAVGIKETEIAFNGNRIEVASCGLSVIPALDSERKPVWKAETSYSVMRLEDAFETSVNSVLFMVPIKDDIALARKLAIHVGIAKVDAALDRLLIETPGRLQG